MPTVSVLGPAAIGPRSTRRVGLCDLAPRISALLLLDPSHFDFGQLRSPGCRIEPGAALGHPEREWVALPECAIRHLLTIHQHTRIRRSREGQRFDGLVGAID